MVESTALEMRHTRKGIVGSNPTLSAISGSDISTSFSDLHMLLAPPLDTNGCGSDVRRVAQAVDLAIRVQSRPRIALAPGERLN